MRRMTKQEEIVKELEEKVGWIFIKPIWPSGIATDKEGKIKMVEVVQRGERLSREKIKSFKLFKSMGIPIEIMMFKPKQSELIQKMRYPTSDTTLLIDRSVQRVRNRQKKIVVDTPTTPLKPGIKYPKEILRLFGQTSSYHGEYAETPSIKQLSEEEIINQLSTLQPKQLSPEEQLEYDRLRREEQERQQQLKEKQENEKERTSQDRAGLDKVFRKIDKEKKERLDATKIDETLSEKDHQLDELLKMTGVEEESPTEKMLRELLGDKDDG